MFAIKNKLKPNFDIGELLIITLIVTIGIFVIVSAITLSIGTTLFVVYVAEYFDLIVITSEILNNQIVRKISFYSIVITVGWTIIKWIYNYWYDN